MKHSQKSHSSAGYHNMIVVLFTLLCVLICGALTQSLNAQTTTSDEHVTPKTLPGRNGKIAFTGGDGIGAIYTTEADGSNLQRLTLNPRHDISPRWSPDGTKIAFESVRDNNSEIYVMNADGSNQTRLTNNPAYDFWPIFSPDGTRIAFGSRRDNNSEIYVMNADGSNQKRLTNDPANDYSYSWSPDSSRIAFTRGGDIYVMDSDGTNQTRLTTEGSDGTPRWSPDGTRIAFFSGSVAGSAGISVMNADGSNQTRLTDAYSYSDSPDWSPDGSRIAFTSNPNNNYDVYVINADGSNQTRLTNDPAFDSSPVFSPDGTRIAFLSDRDKIDNGWNYNDKIYVMNADGSSQTRLTNTAAELYEYKPDWHALPQAAANPIDTVDFFVRQHYLDFLAREPEPSGLTAWLNVLNNCPAGDLNCLHEQRLTTSAAFLGSPEFQLKGYFVFRFYRAAFARLPEYSEISADMSSVSGQTPNDVYVRKSAFANSFVQRSEFVSLFNGLPNADYVAALLSRYNLTSIITPDPSQPDGTIKVTLTPSQLVSHLEAGTLTRAQVLRAIADSDQVLQVELNRAFVAMQYYGYLRRTPESTGYNSWLNYLNAHPGDFREMVRGFVDSIEYRMRFGQP